MFTYLLIIVAIILLCVILNKISSRLGIPMLLAFIALGMFFGSDGVVKIPFDNFQLAEKICSIALIFIMFYGGFGTRWSAAKPVAIKATLLSSIGVFFTAILTGTFCYVILGFDLLESFLIGSVISSTDAASVFSVLRSKKLNLKYNTASLLEMESGSNDPCSYMLTAIVLSMMKGQLSGGKIAYMIFAQITYGIIFGIIISFIVVKILKKFTFATDGFDAIFVLAIAILSYAAPSALGGNGYLSAYIVGIILGNSPINNKKSLVHFFDGITGLMQILIFFLLGLLSFPSQMPKILYPALLIALFLTFVARPLTIFALLIPFKCKVNQKLLVSWAGLRGASSIVFAIVATVSSAYTSHDIYHIVFFIVLISISLQGSLLPVVAKKLNMVDEKEDVLKTFSDYSDEIPVQFVKLVIGNNHPWINKKVKDISLPPETLFVLLLRNNNHIVPKGSTNINKGDILILSAKALEYDEKFRLTELTIKEDNNWIGKHLSDISLEPNKLIVTIKRNGNVVIPNGATVVRKNDVLVINQN